MPRCGPWCAGRGPLPAPGRGPRPASRAPAGRRRSAGPARSWRGPDAAPAALERPAASATPGHPPRPPPRARAVTSAATPVCSASPRSPLGGGSPEGGCDPVIDPETADSTCLKNSPVPTNSCQRASTSPAGGAVGHAVLHVGHGIGVGLLAGLAQHLWASCWAWLAWTSLPVRLAESRAPPRVCLTTLARARASLAR